MNKQSKDNNIKKQDKGEKGGKKPKSSSASVVPQEGAILTA